jgi:hypothetical protein
MKPSKASWFVGVMLMLFLFSTGEVGVIAIRGAGRS